MSFAFPTRDLQTFECIRTLQGSVLPSIVDGPFSPFVPYGDIRSGIEQRADSFGGIIVRSVHQRRFSIPVLHIGVRTGSEQDIDDLGARTIACRIHQSRFTTLVFFVAVRAEPEQCVYDPWIGGVLPCGIH